MKTAAALTAALLSTGLALEARADECSPARLEIILDRSSSMQTGTIGGVPKWSIARGALDAVTAEFQMALELGLVAFPMPDQCAPGDELVEPALGNRARIMAELAAPPPTSGNWTPMAETLSAAADLPSMNEGGKRRFAVLVSDGWQWCSPYDPTTRFAPIDALEELNAAGVTTYVVGFGDSVDALTLNQMAIAAGTERPGCDPTGDTPTAASTCYYQADSASELIDALREIAGNASEETCDGQDNDCDGEVDEDLVRDCATACGTGEETCVSGQWVGCDAPEPQAEVCDARDNDCDGTIDPGCDCTPGDFRACGDDACGTGTQVCDTDGTWGECQDDDSPTSESCDGQDNDCDGETDEFDGSDDAGSLCPPGQTCNFGDCVDLGGGDAPPDEGGNGAEELGDVNAGCGCRTGGPGAGGSLATLLMIAGVLGVVRRRR